MPILTKNRFSLLPPELQSALSWSARRNSLRSFVRASADDKSKAKLPHERDESTGATDKRPREEMKQAQRDIAHGLQDTDRGAEMGRTYKKLKR